MIVFATHDETGVRPAVDLSAARCGEASSVVVRSHGHRTTAEAYNEVLDELSGSPHLEFLVLVDPEVELLDDDLPQRLRALFDADGVALVGAAHDGTAPISPPAGGPVVAVAAGFLALSRWAVGNLRFPTDVQPGHPLEEVAFRAVVGAGRRVATAAIPLALPAPRQQVDPVVVPARQRGSWERADPRCPVCDGADLRTPGPGLVECGTCTSRVLIPSTQAAGEAAEPPADGRHAGDAARRRAQARLSWLQLFCTEGNLVDVRCGTGAFGAAAAAAGFAVLGVDPSPQLVRSAGGGRFRAMPGVLGDLVPRVRPGSVDCVTVWEGLEHEVRLPALLAQARTVLRPGGLLALEARSLGDLLRLGDGSQAWRRARPFHIDLTREGLTSTLEGAGFSIIQAVDFPGRVYQDTEAWQWHHEVAVWRGAGLLGAPRDHLRLIARREA